MESARVVMVVLSRDDRLHSCDGVKRNSLNIDVSVFEIQFFRGFENLQAKKRDIYDTRRIMRTNP